MHVVHPGKRIPPEINGRLRYEPGRILRPLNPPPQLKLAI